MLDAFLASFGTVFGAVVRIFLVAGAAGVLVRRGLVTQDHVRGLSVATVTVFLPCLIFENILRNLEPAELGLWWAIPLVGMAMVATGLAMGALWFCRELPAKRNMLPLSAMQNAGYLVLPVGQMVYPEQFETFALYCFLYILGVSPLLWSVGKHLNTSDAGEATRWRDFITPPFCANVAAVVLVITGLRRWVPDLVLDSVELLGKATVPVATFVLGATLGGLSFRVWPRMWDTFRVLGTKLIAMPLLTIAALRLCGLHGSFPLLAALLVVQASSPPATGLILQVRKYGGNHQETGSIMLIGYGACIITIPVFLALWTALNGAP